MKKRIIAPHKVRLVVRSHFSEPLCFEWGSKFGYVDDSGLRKIRGMKRGGRLADDYVLVYKDPTGKIIRPPQLRIGRRKGEMTFRSRIFRTDEVRPVNK